MASDGGGQAPAALVIVDLLAHQGTPDAELFLTVRHALAAGTVAPEKLFLFTDLGAFAHALRAAGVEAGATGAEMARALRSVVSAEGYVRRGNAKVSRLKHLTHDQSDSGWHASTDLAPLLEHALSRHADKCCTLPAESHAHLTELLSGFIQRTVAPAVRGHRVLLMLRSHGGFDGRPNEHTWWGSEAIVAVASEAEYKVELSAAFSPMWLTEQMIIPLAHAAAAPMDAPVAGGGAADGESGGSASASAGASSGYLMWAQNTCFSSLLTRQLASEFAARTGARPVDVSALMSGGSQAHWRTLADATAPAELGAAAGTTPDKPASSLRFVLVADQPVHSELKSIIAPLSHGQITHNLTSGRGNAISTLAAEALTALQTLAAREAAAGGSADAASPALPRGLLDALNFGGEPVRLAPVPVPPPAEAEAGAGALPAPGSGGDSAAAWGDSSPRVGPAEPDAAALRDVIVSFVRAVALMPGSSCEISFSADAVVHARQRDWCVRARDDFDAWPWPGEEAERPPRFEPRSLASAAIEAVSKSWKGERESMYKQPPRFAAAYAAAADAAEAAARQAMDTDSSGKGGAPTDANIINARAAIVAGLLAARESLREAAAAAAVQVVAMLPADVLTALGATPDRVEAVVAEARRRWEDTGVLRLLSTDSTREVSAVFSHSAGLRAVWRAVLDAAPSPAAPWTLVSDAPSTMTDEQAALYAAAAPRVLMTLPQGAAFVTRAWGEDVHVLRLAAARIRVADAAVRLAGGEATHAAPSEGPTAAPAPAADAAAGGAAVDAPAPAPAPEPLKLAHPLLAPWLPTLTCAAAEETGRPRYAARIRAFANAAAEMGIVMGSSVVGAIAVLAAHVVALPEAEAPGEEGATETAAGAAVAASSRRPELSHGADTGWFALGGIAGMMHRLLTFNLGDLLSQPLTRKIQRTLDKEGAVPVPGFSLRTSTLAKDPFFGPVSLDAAALRLPSAAALAAGAVGLLDVAPEGVDDEGEEWSAHSGFRAYPSSTSSSFGASDSPGSALLTALSRSATAEDSATAAAGPAGAVEARTPGSAPGGVWGLGPLTLQGLEEHLSTVHVREKITREVYKIVSAPRMQRSDSALSPAPPGGAEGDEGKHAAQSPTPKMVISVKELAVDSDWLRRLRAGPRWGLVLSFGLAPETPL